MPLSRNDQQDRTRLPEPPPPFSRKKKRTTLGDVVVRVAVGVADSMLEASDVAYIDVVVVHAIRFRVDAGERDVFSAGVILRILAGTAAALF